MTHADAPAPAGRCVPHGHEKTRASGLYANAIGVAWKSGEVFSPRQKLRMEASKTATAARKPCRVVKYEWAGAKAPSEKRPYYRWNNSPETSGNAWAAVIFSPVSLSGRHCDRSIFRSCIHATSSIRRRLSACSRSVGFCDCIQVTKLVPAARASQADSNICRHGKA